MHPLFKKTVDKNLIRQMFRLIGFRIKSYSRMHLAVDSYVREIRCYGTQGTIFVTTDSRHLTVSRMFR
jgi:hypothetical protein